MPYYNDNGRLFSTNVKNERYGIEIEPTEEQIQYGIIDQTKINILKLEEKKEYYKTLMKDKEQEDILKGFEFKGYKFDADEKAQNFISALLSAVNSGLIEEINYTTKDNQDILLNESDIKELASTCLSHIAFCHRIKRERYKLIESCKTIQELEELDRT